MMHLTSHVKAMNQLHHLSMIAYTLLQRGCQL